MNNLNAELKTYVVVKLYKKTNQSTYMSLRLTSECLLAYGELSNLEKRILNEVKRELAKNAR